MKKLISGLGNVSLAFASLTLFFILFSFFALLAFDISVSMKQSVHNIYKALATYSELYKFTFIVCAFWVALQQLEISQNNHIISLEQIKSIKDKDAKNETLKQCNLFLTEFQTQLKELNELGILDGILLNWPLLKGFTNLSLKENYSKFHEKIDAIKRPQKNLILIFLYKLEAFSAFFICGNTDKQLGKEIIGFTFSEQVASLLGLISYFRTNETTVFGQNTIKLYNEWKTDEEPLPPNKKHHKNGITITRNS